MRSNVRMVVAAAAVGVLAAVTLVVTQQQPRPAVEITKLKDNLFEITGAGGNVAARVTAEGVILVDDKFEQDFADIVAKVKTVTSQPVKYVINTHLHGDHTGSNAQFLRIAEVISTKNARDNMVKANQPGPARIVFTDQTAVYLGGAEVRAAYMGRGHTNGDAVIHFPDLRVVHTGDLINANGPYADYGNGGSIAEWAKTMDGLLALDFDTAIPGHGNIMTKAEVMAYRNRINTLSTRIGEVVRQGVKKEEAAARIKTDDLAPWTKAGIDGFMTRSLPRAFDEAAAPR